LAERWTKVTQAFFRSIRPAGSVSGVPTGVPPASAVAVRPAGLAAKIADDEDGFIFDLAMCDLHKRDRAVTARRASRQFFVPLPGTVMSVLNVPLDQR
jgi:hypothetical protein